MLFFFFLFLGGATVLVISQGIETIGNYIIQVLPMSLQTGVGDEEWMAAWTIFYWAWWISWAPFVGMFVARISRGRTIREFVLGVVAAPDRVRLHLVRHRRRDRHRAAAHRPGRPVGLGGHPGAVAVHRAGRAAARRRSRPAICILLIALFFISGADAASIVMATMASRGSLEPPRVVVVVLGVLMGGIACAMLLVGGLSALQQAAVLGSVPFTFVIVGVAWCWIKALREETRARARPARRTALDVSDRGRSSRRRSSAEARATRARDEPAASLPRCAASCCRRWPRRAATPVEEEGASQQPQGAALRITLGTQDFPEAKIMGELWRQALAVNGYTVDLQKGVGPAAELDRLLQDGEIDGHVAYTGTVLSVVAGAAGVGAGPAGDLRAGQGVLRDPQHGDERDDAVREQGRHRHHARPTPQANQLDLDRRPEEARRRSGSAPGPSSRTCTSGSQGLQRGLRADNASFVPVPVGQQYAALDERRRRTPSTPSPPTRSCVGDDYRCSTTRSCCSARRTS